MAPQALSRRSRPARAGCVLLAAMLLPPAPGVAQEVTKTVIRASAPKVERSLASLRLSVQGFRFEGDVGGTSPEAIERVLAPYAGRELGFAEYEEALHAVARFLRENGHPNANVSVSRAQVRNNIIAVAIQGLTPGTSVPPPLSAAAQAQPVVATQPRVLVREFRVTGGPLRQDEVNAALAGYTNRSLSMKELDEATAALASAYRAKGYGLAQAFMAPQKIENGVVAITVQPGVIDTGAPLVVKSPGQVVKPEVVQGMLARAVRPGEAFRTSELEQALRVAGELPGVASVKADVAPGTQPGTTQVTARVEEGKRVTGSVSADNFGSRYVGQNRATAQLNINSPFGYGEQFNLQGTTASGTHGFKLGASALAHPSGTRVGASYARQHLDIGLEVTPLNLNNDSIVESLFLTQPLLRSAGANVTFVASADGKRYVNNLAGIRDSTRKVHALSLGAIGDHTAKWGGQTAWGAQFTAGRVNLGDTPTYEALDAATARTAGGFSKVNFNVAHLTPLPILGPRFSLYGSLTGQQSGRNLDNAEKFQLGGPTGVRAYPAGEGLGDSGAIATAELRYRLPEVGGFGSQLFTFFDAGTVRQYSDPWANAVPAGRPNSYSLRGGGIGLELVRGESGQFRLVYARKSGSNPNPTAANTDSDGLSRSGRILIFGSISF